MDRSQGLPRSALGFADALGLVVCLTSVLWLPGALEPIAGPKLLALSVGSAALAPWVLWRLRALGQPRLLDAVPLMAAGLLVVWALISAIGSGAPLWVSLFGWWGRSDGVLALLGAAVLLAGGATLRGRETGRVLVWVAAGATIVVIVVVVQLAGIPVVGEGVGGPLVGTMGNTNFSAAYLAIVAVLALGLALELPHVVGRIWAGCLAATCAVLSVLTQAQQGPAALGIGLLVFGVVASVLYKGRWHVILRAATGLVVALAAALLALSFLGAGPLARLWSEESFSFRQQYWKTGLTIAEALPLFGTGPDGLARYVPQYRPEGYVQLKPASVIVDAAHSVPIQMAATMGWVALLLWLGIFGGAVAAVAVRILRGPMPSLPVAAAVSGALAAYLAQALVSIDMLTLLTMGWLLAGLAVALAREPCEAPQAAHSTTRKTGKAKTRQTSSASKAPAWLPIVGGSLALAVGVLVSTQIYLSEGYKSVVSADSALEYATNPAAPCPLRLLVAQQVIQQAPIDVSASMIQSATGLDERCFRMVNLQSAVLLQKGDLPGAARSTALGLELDPLLDQAWLLRAQYFVSAGDKDGATAALDHARRLQDLYPPGTADVNLLESVSEALNRLDVER